MKLLAFIFLTLLSTFSQAQIKLTKLWETSNLPTPESVLPVNNKLYVSLIDGESAKKDGVGGIAILSESGEIINKNWITGLNAPKGMAIYHGKLYVADINEVVKIDMLSAKIEAKILIDEAVFLNDVAINKQGEVFVSDTRLGKIYQLINDQPAIYLDSVKNANGLKFIKEELYVLSGPNLIKINKDKTMSTIASRLASGGDGLEPYKNNEYIATCWVGLIYHINKNGELNLLLDSRKESINTADIGFNAKENILYVPTFLKNSVVAYKLD